MLVSVRDLRSVTQHVPADLLQRRASQLVMSDFLPPINALVEAPKGRTALKLHTCLRADV
jgi:hypothetical protein